jgi:hypothetical protein
MFSRRNFIKTGTAALAAGVATTAVGQNIESLPPVVSSSPSSGSIASTNVNISVADSPLKQALDIYYDNIIKLAQGFGDKDRMLINNTITSFDISQDTPYFNEELFRAFADRVFKDSPENLSSNRADRFSVHYERLIRAAAAKIDRQYDRIIHDVDDLQKKVEDQTTKLTNRINSINKQWNDLAKTMGLQPSDIDYELKYTSYLEQIRYADQIGQYSDNIDMLSSGIDAVRRGSYTPKQQLLLDCINELSRTKKVARPLRPNFERTVKNVTEFTFADPTYRAESIMDISPSAYPLGDLVKFLKEGGQRTVTIGKTATNVEQHDKSWSAGGSARFSIFGIGIGGGAGGSGSSSYRQQIDSASSIAITYANMAEYFVDRGLWFDPSIFQDDELVKILSKIPGFDRLQYVSKSLIIGRGTTIVFKFNNAVDTTQWSKQSFQASGGVSIFGYGFGGSGSSSSYDYSLEISGDKKTVTFRDDPQLVRLVAVRLETFAKIPQPVGGIASVENNLARMRKGEIDYLAYQNAKFVR